MLSAQRHLNKLGSLRHLIRIFMKDSASEIRCTKGDFCFLSREEEKKKTCFGKSESTRGPLLSPNLHLSRTASLKETKGFENECSTTHRRAHFAICLVVSRGAKGLKDTPEFSPLQVEMPKSGGGGGKNASLPRSTD